MDGIWYAAKPGRGTKDRFIKKSRLFILPVQAGKTAFYERAEAQLTRSTQP
jgi:hypothetical protein